MQRLMFVTLALAGTLPAIAANTDKPLEETVITATRVSTPANALPNRVTLIDQESLIEQLAISTSVLDAIGTQVPSVSPTRQKLSTNGETMRGREPLYMIDGVPQSNPLRNGSRDGFTLDPAVIERVEVLYGANAIQGVGATGGIVNYVTRSAAEGDDWRTRFDLGTTMTDTLEDDGFDYRASVVTSKDFGALDLVLGLAYESRGAFYDGAGRRIGVDNTQGDIQDSDAYNVFVKLGWDISADTRLQLMANTFDLQGDGDYVPVNGNRNTGLPTSSERGTYPGDPTENQVRTVSLDLTHAFDHGGRFIGQLYSQDFEAIYGGGTFATFQDVSIAPFGTLFDQSANNSEKRGVKLAYSNDRLPVAGMSLMAGMDYIRDLTFQELIQTGRDWVPETEFKSLAMFVQLGQALVNDRLHLNVGVRQEEAELNVDTYQTLADYGSQTVSGGQPEFDETLWNAGISFDVIDGLTLYASYAEGFGMPDVGRTLRGIDVPDIDVDTFLNLRPIIADNKEIGIKFSAGPVSGDIGYFWSESDLGQRLEANSDGIFLVRREHTAIEGLEASVQIAATDTLMIGANYAHLEGQYDSDGDNDVDTDLGGLNISPDRLNLHADWRASQLVSLHLQASRFFNRSFNDGSDTTDFDGYTLVDTVIGFDMARNGRVDVAVQNLLDEEYISYYSQTATSGAANFYAGRGRTLTLRWSNTF